MADRSKNRDSPRPLTPVVFHTLLVLAEAPLHGYGISQAVDDLTEGRIRMGPGTLYGTLQRLQEAGWLARTDDVEASGSHADRRRYYRLTSSGRAALETEARRLARAVGLARDRAILDGP